MAYFSLLHCSLQWPYKQPSFQKLIGAAIRIYCLKNFHLWVQAKKLFWYNYCLYIFFLKYRELTKKKKQNKKGGMNQCMETKEQHTLFSSDWAQNGLCSSAPTDVIASYISSCWKWVGLDWSISLLYLKRKKLKTCSPDLNFYKNYPCYLHFLWLSHLHLNITWSRVHWAR